MSTLIFANGNGYSGMPLLSTMNLYEHEALIISPSSLYDEIRAGSTMTAAKQRSVANRMNELVTWVERGHTLIVLGLAPAPYHWAERGSPATRTGIEQLPPFNKIKLTAKSGSSVRAAPVAASLLEGFINSIGYDFILHSPNIIPLLFTRTTTKAVGPPDVVAGAIQLGEGFVIFAPEVEPTIANNFWRTLSEMPPLLRAPKPEFPAWVDLFQTRWEVATFGRMSAVKAEWDRLQAELATLDSEIDEARQLKQLFVGTGALFEGAVAAALIELGLQVVKGPYPRADLLASNGQRVAAIEAKGVEGGAREEYVRQVMMWMPEVDAALAMEAQPAGDDPVLEEYRQHLSNLNLTDRDKSQDCKGILVLGTFRLTRLDERTQPDFPENVKAVLVRQDICALTGAQLFVLMVLARSDQGLKKQVKEALFNTRGVLELGADWRQGLENVDRC